MTGLEWLLAAGAPAGLLALGAVFARRRRGVERSFLEPGEAMDFAEQSVAGFVAVSGVVGSDGRAALVIGEGRRIVVLKAQGRRAAAREVRWDDIRATFQGMVVDTGVRRLGSVLVAGVDNLDMRRLSAEP